MTDKLLKKFTVKEIYTVTGWTTIKAESLEDARHKLENETSPGHNFVDHDWEHSDTEWDTLEEVTR